MLPKNATVSISKCRGYDNFNDVLTSVQQSLEPLGNLTDLFGQGKRVLVKPNLLDVSRGPESAINTHPAVIRALVQILKREYNCHVFIGDSSGGVYGKTQYAFKNSGLLEVAQDLDVELLDFDREKQITLQSSQNILLKEITIPAIFRKVDCVINVPKLKTHDLMEYTGCIKNMFGAISGSGKRDIHVFAPRAEEMANCLVDIYHIVKPNLCVMDAIVGMEGPGPSAGNPKDIGLILASRDGVALDTVATAIVGFKPLEISTTRIAAERGVGNANITDITIEGESIEDVSIPDFQKTPRYNYAKMNFLPDFVVKQLWRGQTGGRPVINQKMCEVCETCAQSCPAEAIEMQKDQFVIDHAKCIECYCCCELCPHEAIYIELPILVRMTSLGVTVARKLLNIVRSLKNAL